MTALQDFSFKHRIKVRWVEVDPQQVVFNGHYLTYFDTAMSEYWRAVGQPYPEGFNFFGGEVFIRRNTIEYHAPGKLDDWLDIGIRCDRVGNSSITMAWSVWTQGRLLVTGESVYVFTTLNTAKPVAVPPGLRQQAVGARHAPSRVVHRRSSRTRLAEADGNRTRQTELLGLTGFEDRGAHQEPSRLRREPYTVVRTAPDAGSGSTLNPMQSIREATRLTGYAHGGGCELAAACDLRVVERQAPRDLGLRGARGVARGILRDRGERYRAGKQHGGQSAHVILPCFQAACAVPPGLASIAA